jgi:hypothetical protein
MVRDPQSRTNFQTSIGSPMVVTSEMIQEPIRFAYASRLAENASEMFMGLPVESADG